MAVCILYQLIKDRQDYLEAAEYEMQHKRRHDAEWYYNRVHYIESLLKLYRSGDIYE